MKIPTEEKVLAQMSRLGFFNDGFVDLYTEMKPFTVFLIK